MEENIAHAEEGVAVAASEEEVPIAATKPVTNSATGPTVDDPIDTPNGLSTPERTLLSSSSIQSIKLKLLTQGLTDEVPASRTNSISILAAKKRLSRSCEDLLTQTAKPLRVADRKKSLRCLKLAPELTAAAALPVGLEQLKKDLLGEIKSKLVEQIVAKKSQQIILQKTTFVLSPSSPVVNGSPPEGAENNTEAAPTVQIQEKPKLRHQQSVPNEVVAVVDGDPQPKETSKRYSIGSLNLSESRKPYSPVYERTRKIVRQSITSMNGLSASQQQVQPRGAIPEEKKEQLNSDETASPTTSKKEALERKDSAVTAVCASSDGTSQVLVVNVDVTAARKPPTDLDSSATISSLQSLLTNRTDQNLSIPDNDKQPLPQTPNNTTDREFYPPQNYEKVMNSSYPRMTTRSGNFSAHPSMYMIERDKAGGGSGSGGGVDSRSERSTRTPMKRTRDSFRGLKNNLKKTFSSHMTPLTLEKADKGTEAQIPMIVECCITTLQQKNFLRTEGLYRSSPSQMEVRKVIKHARKGEYDYVRRVDDPVLLAGTLKSFFFSLKTHVISQELMEKNFPRKCLIMNVSEQDYVGRLKGLVADLDTVHYDTLEYLIKHLQEVASYSRYNLMTPSNLGVVWAPCLFTNCDKTMDGADLLSFMGQQTRLMELLITRADDLFDRYMIDEITLAIEDGYTSAEACGENDRPIIDERPNFEANGINDIAKRKLLRNLSVTLDDRPSNGHYELQQSCTVPAMGAKAMQQQQAPPKSGKNILTRNAAKRDRNRSVCVIS